MFSLSLRKQENQLFFRSVLCEIIQGCYVARRPMIVNAECHLNKNVSLWTDMKCEKGHNYVLPSFDEGKPIVLSI